MRVVLICCVDCENENDASKPDEPAASKSEVIRAGGRGQRQREERVRETERAERKGFGRKGQGPSAEGTHRKPEVMLAILVWNGRNASRPEVIRAIFEPWWFGPWWRSHARVGLQLQQGLSTGIAAVSPYGLQL